MTDQDIIRNIGNSILGIHLLFEKIDKSKMGVEARVIVEALELVTDLIDQKIYGSLRLGGGGARNSLQGLKYAIADLEDFYDEMSNEETDAAIERG